MFFIMSDYNNNRQYRSDQQSEYRGKRFKSGGYDYENDFDVVEDVPQQKTYPQNYDRRPMPYRQNYERRPQQYPPYDRMPRQQYPQQGYYQDEPRRTYGDSYQYDDRQREYADAYDDRYEYRPAKPVKKRSGGGFLGFIKAIAIIMLLVGLGIVGYKGYNYFMANYAHKELTALSQDFDKLKSMNGDFFGWLKIDDTNIDYPVMYTPDEPERYLHMNFDREYSDSGELFLDAECDPEGYHYLIYGHHMNDGSMLGSLPKYEDKDYYDAHKTFRFDTMNERGEYEIFAVFYSQIYDENDDVFKYYENTNLNDEATYQNYVNNVKSLSIYDTGITPTYGEKIVTLSTCNYHTDNGRFVICARKIA